MRPSAVGVDILRVTPSVVTPSTPGILAFWRAGSSDPLECWEVNDDGSPGAFFASVAVDDQVNTQFTERGRRMVLCQSLVASDGSGTISTPALAWFVAQTTAAGTSIKGYCWCPFSGDLFTWQSVPRNPGSGHDVSAPVARPTSDGFLYWVQSDLMPSPDNHTRSLWRVPLNGGTPEMLDELTDVGASGPDRITVSDDFLIASASIRVSYAGEFTFPVSGYPSGMANSVAPYAGNDGSVEVSVGFRISGSIAPRRKRKINFDGGTITHDTGWASAATSTHGDHDCVMSVNVARDTDGMFPYDGPTASGANMKLSQPRGTTSDDGNDDEPPLIFIAERITGHEPHSVYLHSYSHPWA